MKEEELRPMTGGEKEIASDLDKFFEEYPPYGECPTCHELLATDEEKSRNLCDNCNEEELEE